MKGRKKIDHIQTFVFGDGVVDYDDDDDVVVVDCDGDDTIFD